MLTTKVVMVIMLMGTYAPTGKGVSTVNAINLYPSMKLCMAQRNMFRAAMKRGLEEADWLTNGGKVKVNHANLICVDIDKLEEKGAIGT